MRRACALLLASSCLQLDRAALFRLGRCKEQLPKTIDVSAVRRKFIRLRPEAFQEEAEEVAEARAMKRRSFELVSEFGLLYRENDQVPLRARMAWA